MAEFNGADLGVTATSNDGELIAQMQMEPKQAERVALQLLLAATEIGLDT